MKNFRNIFFYILFFIMIFFSHLKADSPGDKLFRGLGNVLSGWMEVPLNIYEESFEKNIIFGLTLGLLKGLVLGSFRTFVGCYETATFFLPFPPNYEPVFSPELVFEKDI